MVKSELPSKRLKVRVPRPIRNALISIVVLVVLFAVVGVGYTWFVGQSGPVVTPTVTPVAEKAVVPIRPTKPAPNAKESAAVQFLTSPVAPGQNASISVKTNATSKCTISVIYGTAASTDSGLAPKVADDFGTISWTWTVGPSVPLGTWPVKVTCQYNTQSAVVQGDLVVAK